MILEPGSSVLLVHRRLFENDQGRFFVGTVDAYADGVAKVRGTSWMRDPYSGRLIRKEDERTKIMSLSSGTVMAYELPPGTNTSSIEIRSDESQRVVLTDGQGLVMDLTERYHR